MSAPTLTPIFVNIRTAAQLVGMTRYQLWALARAYPEKFPVLHVGKRKRLIDPLKLRDFLETTFAPKPSVRRGRGRPRKTEAVPAEAVRA